MVLKNSVIYTVSTLVQKGLVFLLLPFYLRYLTPEEYGTITVIISVSLIFSVFFTLGLDSAVVRFYYDAAGKEIEFKSFFGTLLISLFGIAVTNFTLISLLFPRLLGFFLPNIAFYPFIFVGFAIMIFQPVYNLTLALLQAQNKAIRYSILSFVYLIINVALTLYLIIHLAMGALGYLTAILLAQAITMLIGLVLIRREFRLSFQLGYLKKALKYSLPLVPHSLFSQASGYADRIILNKFISTAQTGVYHLGYVLSIPVEIITYSINRAYTPVFFKNADGDQDKRSRIIDTGLAITLVYFTAGIALVVYAKDILYIFFSETYLEAYKVIPFVCFSFVHMGLYYLFSTVLFFDTGLTRYVPVCTFISGTTIIALDLVLIPVFGFMGAGVAIFTGQLILATAAYLFSLKSPVIRWPIARILACYVVAVILAASVFFLTETLPFSIFWMASKLLILPVFILVAGWIYWGTPLKIASMLRAALKDKRS